MLSLNFIREHEQEVIDRLAIKNFSGDAVVRRIVELDDKRRETQKQLDDIQAQSNSLAKEIGILFKSGKTAEANLLKDQTGELKNHGKELDLLLESIKKELDEILVRVPNLPHPSVPRGKTPEDNLVVMQEGEIKPVDPTAVPHWDLTTKYDIIDFITGNKITGAGFPVYKGKGARLQRALINFFLDEAMKVGYAEVQPPYMVNAASAYATGQLPDKDAQMYHADLDDLYLIPTAEVPVTNIYRDTILKSQDLPMKNVAYSACFRREAGSYGKDVRG
ncbi:MAG: aminoacyl--tRNA ligase-related protein, partial [Bacteroidales bacterium]